MLLTFGRFGVAPCAVQQRCLSAQARTLQELLAAVASGSVDPALALGEARQLAVYEELESAKLDHGREARTGLPEVVFGQGKTTAHIVEIMRALAVEADVAIVTRVEPEVHEAMQAAGLAHLTHYPEARIVAVASKPGPPRPARKIEGTVVVMTAGTCDLPVAEEAAVTAELMGVTNVVRLWDVGVAGIHRLLRNRDKLDGADVIVAAAGMEGALPSVVAGLVEAPIVAVPTSFGYGASLSGVTPLLTMLSSCAPGIGVVNIDNGFGAAMLATKMLRARINANA